MLNPLAALPPVGTRVALTRDVERYPHFIAPAGAVGTVVTSDSDTFIVLLDTPPPGSEEWSGELHWYDTPDSDDPRDDLRITIHAHTGAPFGPAAR